MNKKKIIVGIGVIIILCGAFFFAIHPVWLESGSDVRCIMSDYFTEDLEAWASEDSVDTNLDAFSGKFPSTDSGDYRQLTLDFSIANTSIFGIQGMCVYVKNIDCDNKKNVLLLQSSTYDESGFETIRLSKEEYGTPYILVYVGDLDTEEEIEDRMEDIAKHTTYEMVCTMQWLGTRKYSWSAGNKIRGYVIEDSYTGKKERIK